MAGHDHERGVVDTPAHLVEGLQDELLLSAHRAAGDPERPDGRTTLDETHQRLGRGALGHRVELEVAGDPDPVGRGTQGQDPLRLGLSLHEEEVDLREHPAEERANPPIAPEGAVRDAAVHHRHAGAAPVRLVDEVGPQLRLDQDQQRRVEGRERLAHRPRPVERGVEEPVQVARRLGRRPRCRWSWSWTGRGRGRGSARAGLGRRGRTASTSPTDTAWIQIDGPPRAVQVDGQSGPSARERCASTCRWPGLSRGTRAGRGQSRRRGECCRGCTRGAPRSRGPGPSGARKYNVRRTERRLNAQSVQTGPNPARSGCDRVIARRVCAMGGLIRRMFRWR